MNFVIFLLNFDEFLSEFHEELQKIAVYFDLFRKLLEKFGKCSKFPVLITFYEEFDSSVSLFQSTP